MGAGGDYYFAGSDKRIFRFCAEENEAVAYRARDQFERKFSLSDIVRIIALAGMF
jgi:hypothetical protein